jgi:hypothetical protein
MWKYNRIWNASLDWKPLDNHAKYKKAHCKLTDKIINDFSDKIFLYEYFKKNNISASPIIYYSYDDYDIREVLKDKLDYVVKPNHLCTQQGIFIVKNGRLVKAVQVQYLKKFNLPKYFEKFKRGYKISVDEIIDAMTVLKDCDIDKLCPNIKSGIIVEELHQGTEVKVFCLLGKILGSYYMKGNGFDLEECNKLAEKVINKTGIDYVRIDIIKYDNEYRVSEFTLNPFLHDKECKKKVEENWEKIYSYHNS